MTILVTGGGGFVGTAVIRAMRGLGIPVTVLDRNPPPADLCEPRAEMTWHVGEVCDQGLLGQALSGATAVVHLASTASPAVADADWQADVQAQVIDSIGVMNGMRAAGVRRLVYLSSGGTVYGHAYRTRIDESRPAEPMQAYGVNKLAVEHFARLARAAGWLDPVILRPANAFGPAQRTDRHQGIVGTAIHCALTRRPLQIWGDGLAVRDFVYVDDLARAIVAATRYEGAHTTFNIGSGVGRTVHQVVAAIEGMTGASIMIEQVAPRGLDAPYNVLDCTRARRELGWQPLVSFEEGLAATIAWYRARPG